MYSYEILPEARDQVDGLPSVALIYYAELITSVELTPWDAPPYRDDNPMGTSARLSSAGLAKASPSTSSWRTNAVSSW